MKIGTAITALFASLVLGATAHAADIYAPPPAQVYEPTAPVSVYNWTGLYLGANVGYAWGDATATIPGVGSGSASFDGAIGGAQIGYNMHADRFVIGIEADLQATGIGDSANFLGFTETTDVDWLATVRGRVGVAAGRWMPYVTGGVAFAHVDDRITGPGLAISSSNTHTGWTLGGGVEVGMTENISLKAEYLYVDLGSESYYGGLIPGGVSLDADAHILRTGLNWRFTAF